MPTADLMASVRRASAEGSGDGQSHVSWEKLNWYFDFVSLEAGLSACFAAAWEPHRSQFDVRHYVQCDGLRLPRMEEQLLMAIRSPVWEPTTGSVVQPPPEVQGRRQVGRTTSTRILEELFRASEMSSTVIHYGPEIKNILGIMPIRRAQPGESYSCGTIGLHRKLDTFPQERFRLVLRDSPQTRAILLPATDDAE
jgi:hypothetical protein